MPIYAYRCAVCGHAKDVLQKLSDPLLTTCPSCGAETFRKQLTAAGFQLKGSGWYVTDFKGGPPAGKPGGGKPDAGGAEPAKSDAPKPAEAAAATGGAEAPAPAPAKSDPGPAASAGPAPAPSGPPSAAQ